MRSASVTVTYDNVAPDVVIDSPPDGVITDADRVDVTGVVNDVLTALGAPLTVVKVNGAPAAVSHRAFVAVGVPLKPGRNTLTAVATDNAGNTGQAAITVTRQDLAGQRIVVVSGNNQSGPVGSELENPLIVRLVDAEDHGVANRLVTFTVTRGSGTLAGGTGNGQTVVRTTGSEGRAEARFTLGANAGEGSHRVTATASGFVGEAGFCASAAALAPDRIVVLSGDNQMGAINEVLPLPLVTAVLDADGNPLAGVAVTFSVLDGGGSVSGSATSTMMTGPDGKAAAALRLGHIPGVNGNRVQVAFPGLSGLPAIFTASSALAGQAAETSISGVVLDNSDLPMPGVIASVPGTPLHATADGQGRFKLSVRWGRLDCSSMGRRQRETVCGPTWSSIW